MPGFNDSTYQAPNVSTNGRNIATVDPGNPQVSSVSFPIVLSTTAITLLVPPDPLITNYSIQNQSVTAAEKMLFTEDGFTPATVSAANVAGRYRKLAPNDSSYTPPNGPSADGLQAFSESGTPTVNVTLYYG